MSRPDAHVISTRELAEGAAELVERVRERGESIMVVENGETQAVLVTAAEFEAIREHRRFVAAVEQGLEDVEAGRSMSTAELKDSLQTELGAIAWP